MTARTRTAPVLLLLVCLHLAGCDYHREVGVGERCADTMRTAYPTAEIEVTKSEASPDGMSGLVANVEAVRTDMTPDSPLTHDLAVECRYDHNVLTGFRWTKGPLR